MEPENKVKRLQQSLWDILLNFKVLGQSLTKQSENIFSQMESNEQDFDLQKFEQFGIKIAVILKKLKGNSITYTNSLLKSINDINSNKTEKILCNMHSKLLESRSNSIVFENGKHSFAQLADKETITDIINHELNSSTYVLNKCDENLVNTSSDSKEFAINSLSLRRETTADTINTEDSWRDTLQRSPGNKHLFKKDTILETCDFENVEMELNTSFAIENNLDGNEVKKEDLFLETFAEIKSEEDNDVFDDVIDYSESQNLKKTDSNETIEYQGVIKNSKNEVNNEIMLISSDDEIYYTSIQKKIKNPSQSFSENNNSFQELCKDEQNLNLHSVISSDKNKEDASAAIQSSCNIEKNKLLNNTESITDSDICDKNKSMEDPCNKKDNQNNPLSEINTALTSKDINPHEVVGNFNSPNLFDEESEPKNVEVDIQDNNGTCQTEKNCMDDMDDIKNKSNSLELKDYSPVKENNKNLNEQEDIDDYKGPYSVETDKWPSEDENETQINSDVHMDHSYICTSIPDGEDKNPDTNINESTSEDELINNKKLQNSSNETEKIDSLFESTNLNRRDQIFSDHNYTPSYSETYLEEALTKSDTVQFNNHTLDSTVNSEDGRLSKLSSTKSFEFDASNYENKDIENEEELMDVTLEEILSNDGKESKPVSSSHEMALYFGLKREIKSEDSEEEEENCAIKKQQVLIEDELMKLCDVSPNTDISDELLQLFKKVPGDEIEASTVDGILMDLEEDSSEISSTDSASSSDSGDSTDDLEIFDSGEKDLTKEKKEHNMIECYVPLERLQHPEITSKNVRLNDNDVNRLCDLTKLGKKRNHTSSLHYKKRRKKIRKDNSSSSSLGSSDSTSDSNNGDHGDENTNIVSLNMQQKQKLDDILAGVICNEFKNGSGKESENSSDTDGSAKNIKKINSSRDKENSKKPLTKDELQKKAWKNDPLLRGKLTSSESDAHKSKNKNNKTKRYEYDSNFSIHSEVLSLDSDNENMQEKNKSKLLENSISPIKRNIPDSDSSDCDSDVQCISPVKFSQNTVSKGSSQISQKGRRNIRSIVDDQFLTEETQKAKKEELKRIERLKDRNKVLEIFSQSFNSQLHEEVLPLILDVDDKTGDPLVQVNSIITKKMKPHQRKGVKFMWDSCYESLNRIKEDSGSGCILAHCMGLGKTFQVLALIQTLFSYDETNTKHVLIVCPLSTVNNWKKEIRFAYNNLPPEKKCSLFLLPNSNIQEKCDVVNCWRKHKKAILVVGYEGFVTITNKNKMDKLYPHLRDKVLEALVDPGPDLVVCDEGHLIKNKKATRAKALYQIATKRRIVLTGTPLQNNLIEYYHMVHFVKPNLLGTLKEFTTNFVHPITNGQYEDSTLADIKVMRSRTHVLHKILSETVQRIEESELEIYLPKMIDYAVFIQLHQVQVDLYNLFYNHAHNRSENVDKSVLSDFHQLQYLCTHPHLLNLMEKSKNKVKQQDVVFEDVEVVNVESWWKNKMPPDTLNNIKYGSKLEVLRAIIEECETIGDKLLIFSQKLAELDLIEHFLKTIGTNKNPSWKRGFNYLRLDGTVAPDKRAVICDDFNNENNKSLRLLLMTTQVGGLGLNLTAANRVVLMTVHWNPSYDTQSIFRVYRFGQKKKVFVYRLISLDTMEEKVYQRSVTKLAISHRVIDKHQIDRHYKSVELQELYNCKPSTNNERETPNVPEDEVLAKLILKLPCIFKYHKHKELLVNRPEHKLSEQEMTAAWEEFKDKDQPAPPLPQPQFPSCPSFEQGFNLGRFNMNQTNANHTSYQPPQYTQKPQYYKHNVTKLGQTSASSQRSNIQNDNQQPSTSTSSSNKFIHEITNDSSVRNVGLKATAAKDSFRYDLLDKYTKLKRLNTSASNTNPILVPINSNLILNNTKMSSTSSMQKTHSSSFVVQNPFGKKIIKPLKKSVLLVNPSTLQNKKARGIPGSNKVLLKNPTSLDSVPSTSNHLRNLSKMDDEILGESIDLTTTTLSKNVIQRGLSVKENKNKDADDNVITLL